MVSIKLAKSVFLGILNITSYTLDFNRLYYILLSYINMKLKYLEYLTNVEQEKETSTAYKMGLVQIQ